MSIIICNGYRLPSWSMNRLQNFINLCRKEMKKATEEEAARAMGHTVVGIADILATQGTEKFTEFFCDYRDFNLSASLLESAWSHLASDKDQEKVFEYTANYKLVFAPIPGGILVRLYADEKSKFRESFKNLKHVKEYNYSGAAQPPRGISNEEWLARKKAWTKVCNTDGSLASNDFVFNIESTVPFGKLKINSILKDIPPKQERVEPLVSSTIFGGQVERHTQVYKDTIIKKMLPVYEYTRSEEYQQEVIQKKAEFLPHMVDAFTEDVLHREIGSFIQP